VADIGRDFQSGKQARHRWTPDAEARLRNGTPAAEKRTPWKQIR
jgi:hypothetical protein